jgi:hypothetical protein
MADVNDPVLDLLAQILRAIETQTAQAGSGPILSRGISAAFRLLAMPCSRAGTEAAGGEA